MKYAARVLTALAICFSITTYAQQKKDVVAVVGSKEITLEEFNKKFNDIKASTSNPPTREQFLEDLVRYEMGVQEAYKQKLENDPIVQERIRTEVYKAFIEKNLGAKVQKLEVTENEMKEWYKKNPEIRTSHVLVEYKVNATAEQKAEAKKRATEILKEIQNSKRPFEELVKLYSDDSLSKQNGGDVGWQSRVTLVPSYYDAAVNLKVGEIKGLVETPFGFHVIKLTGKRAYENADKRQIRAAVFDEKRRLAFNEFFDKLKKSYTIKVNKLAE